VIEQIGRYRIAGELGRGAMGVVYRAEDPAIGRTVAIKTIRLSDVTESRERQRLRERLLREAQSAGILSHPGIVTIYDIAEEDGLCYIFMEFVNGNTLERLIARGELPEPAALLNILRQTAAALDYAHQRGIIHRDVKPANIMVDSTGSAKVTDFGVSRFVSQEMTHTGGLMGTPSYMSPEQIQGHPVDGRADQFALAVIAYEALTGEKPFVADSLPALVYRIVRDEPAPAHRINQTLNGGVDGVLRKALSKDPAQRFPTCTDFIHALANALATAKGWRPIVPGTVASMPTVAVPAPPPVSAAPPPIVPRQIPDIQVKKSGGSLAKGLVIGALAGVVMLGLIFILPRVLNEGYAGRPPDRTADPAAATTPAQTTPGISAPDNRPSPMGPPVSAQQPADTPTTPQSTTAQQASPVAGDQSDPDADAEPQREPETTTRPAPAPPKRPEVRDRSRERVPPVDVPHTVRITANPEGSQIVVDKDPALTCVSPCILELPAGRHTLVASRAGYHNALRIFQVPDDALVQFDMSQEAGQLIVRTNPQGAFIYLNGRVQSKTTPAVLTVPAGHYHLLLRYEGHPQQEDEIEIRDGAISNYEFNWVR
jgi:serine/threonine-protein kinase